MSPATTGRDPGDASDPPGHVVTDTRRGSRRLALAGLACLLLGLLVGFDPATAPPAAAGSTVPRRPLTTVSRSGVTVTATPTAQLSDGQAVAITVKADAGVLVNTAEAHYCRPGVAYQTSTDPRPAIDFKLGGANCPLIPVSSSSDTIAIDAATSIYANTPEGETFLFRAGYGRAEWQYDGQPRSLDCDADHPCAIVVELLIGTTTPVWTPFVIEVTLRNDDPIKACGGVAKDALQSGGSDRMNDAWVNWTLAACRRPGSAGAPSRATFTGEATSASSFATGAADLTYAAAGYDDDVALVSPDVVPAADRRAMVPVPVALNAAVLAVGNGYLSQSGRKVPYSDLKLTLTEVAALLSGGTYGITPYVPAILARNPELAGDGMFQTSNTFQVAASSLGDTPNWLLTNHEATLRPDDWKVPNQPGPFGAEAGLPRGRDNDFATAIPAYQNALSLFTGRLTLQRQISGLNVFGGVWVFTDLATARAFGMTPVKIENANGQFVGPTTESLLAAVPTMKKGKGGTWLPVPSATATGTVQPYPLTMVEYALAPAEPLYNEDCTLRTDANALLKDWLTFITTSGQAELPTGFEPLPPALRAEAAAAIPKVGASPISGTCKDGPTTTTTEPTSTTTTEPPPTTLAETPVYSGYEGAGSGSGASASGSDSSGVVPVAGTGSGGGAPLANTPVATARTTATARAGTTTTALAAVPVAPAAFRPPDYAGARGGSVAGGLFGLIGIVLLGSAAAMNASGGRRFALDAGNLR